MSSGLGGLGPNSMVQASNQRTINSVQTALTLSASCIPGPILGTEMIRKMTDQTIPDVKEEFELRWGRGRETTTTLGQNVFMIRAGEKGTWFWTGQTGDGPLRSRYLRCALKDE